MEWLFTLVVGFGLGYWHAIDKMRDLRKDK